MSEPEKKKDAPQEEPPAEPKLDTAFLQVPVAIRDEVQQIIKDLMSKSDTELSISNDSISALPEQGCFLVISLDKIEEIINGLRECLTMEPDNGARNIKGQIERVLTLLG